MRVSNMQRQYYNDLSHSRYSSQTSRKLKSVAGREDFNDTKTRFQTRIEKACTTRGGEDLNKQVGLYRKQIERLEKEVLKKDKIIFEIRSTTALNKELEAELIETYRVIYMYEGKISQYEKELKRLEIALSKQLQGESGKKVEELLQSYRIQNSDLMGKVEESNRTILELETKLKKVEAKYFSASWKLSSTKRQISNPLKKKFPNLRNTITLQEAPLLEKEKAMNLRVKDQKVKQTQSNEYQIGEGKQRGVGVQKEPIRFKKLENRPPQNISYNQTQNSAKKMLGTQQNRGLNHSDPLDKSNNKSIQISKRQSPITERKVYMSPVTRFELNKKVEEVSNMMDSASHRHRFSMSTHQHHGNSRTIYY